MGPCFRLSHPWKWTQEVGPVESTWWIDFLIVVTEAKHLVAQGSEKVSNYDVTSMTLIAKICHIPWTTPLSEGDIPFLSPHRRLVVKRNEDRWAAASVSRLRVTFLNVKSWLHIYLLFQKLITPDHNLCVYKSGQRPVRRNRKTQQSQFACIAIIKKLC